jgi:hypothetical protein
MTANLKERLNSKLQTQETNTTDERITIMQNTNTALAPAESGFLALTNNALDIISENLKNQPLSQQLFDVIKSPSGGATAFTVPTISGEDMLKELTGIILDYSTPRAYWRTPEPKEGTPPDCYSKDSLISINGKPCNRCVYNEFGSNVKEDSQAKACKESVNLILLRQDNIMPIIIRVPVSSKLAFQRYMTRLIGNMIPVCGVVTRITLEKSTSKNGQPYALYNFEAVGTLDQDEVAAARAFGTRFVEFLKAANVEPAITEAG